MVIAAALACFLSFVPTQDDTPIPEIFREVMSPFPAADRQRLQVRWVRAWKELDVGLSPGQREGMRREFHSHLSRVASTMRPLSEECRMDGNPGMVDVAAYFTPEERADYRARHEPLARRIVESATEYLDLSIEAAFRSRPTPENRAVLLRQFESLMDVVDEALLPYLPADPAKLAVVKSVLADQRQGLQVLFPDSPSPGGAWLTQPLTSREMEDVVHKIRAMVAEYGEEIPVPAATGNENQDLETFYRDSTTSVLEAAINGALMAALLEKGAWSRDDSELEAKFEEFEMAAKEHRALDDRIRRIAIERFNAAHAYPEPTPKEGPAASSGKRDPQPASNPIDPVRSRKSGASVRGSPGGGRTWIVVGLLALGGLVVAGSWIARRRAA